MGAQPLQAGLAWLCGQSMRSWETWPGEESRPASRRLGCQLPAAAVRQVPTRLLLVGAAHSGSATQPFESRYLQRGSAYGAMHSLGWQPGSSFLAYTHGQHSRSTRTDGEPPQ